MPISETPVAAFTVNDTLNPILWDNDELRLDIRYKLLSIAKHFADTLKVKNLNLTDVTISGSNASFGYSEYSDIDLHLVVDMPDDDELADYYNAKKNEFNNKYDVKLKSIPVEVYVQSSSQTHHSAGIFSVLDNKWLHKPSKKIPKATPQEIKSKARNYSSKINQALTSKELSVATETMADIRRLRQAGLEMGCEESVENLAFKLLRSRGKIDKLRNHIDKLQSAELSLGEQMKINDIVKENVGQSVQVKSYEPGKSLTYTQGNDQSGVETQSTIDLAKHPGLIGMGADGKPVLQDPSKLTNPANPTAPAQTEPKIMPGSQITINTDGQNASGEMMGENPPGITAFETSEEKLEDEDLMGSGVDHLKNPHDRTADFINDIVDKRFERGARGSMSSKTSGSFGPVSGKLQESDELYKWLTIAGIK